MHVILIQILTHIFEFVKVSQLSLFVVHDDFFFLFDTPDDLVELGIEINMHTLNIVSLGFVTKEAEEDLFLLLQVDWFGAFRHATWWIWTESKEISENITCLLFLGLSS